MSKNTKRLISPYIAIFIIIAVVFFLSTNYAGKTNTLTYSVFKQKLAKNKVETVEISPSKESSVYTITGKLKGYSKGEKYVKNTC